MNDDRPAPTLDKPGKPTGHVMFDGKKMAYWMPDRRKIKHDKPPTHAPGAVEIKDEDIPF